jgi:hypothetical protein
MGKKYKILITGACGVTSRSLVRALQKSEIFHGRCEFIGTDICNLLYAPFEGLYKKIYYVPPFNDPKYEDTISRIIQENEIEYAFIIPEPETLFWSENPFPVKFMRIPPKFAKEVLSKRRLYENLAETDLTPKFQVLDKKALFENSESIKIEYPLWIRDYSEGTTSGRGSLLVDSYEKLKAWIVINEKVENFMLAEYLPRRNLACFLSYDNGSLIQYGVAERVNYLMAKVAVSGITGNTSYGRLLNDEKVFQVAKNGVEKILEKTGDVMNGLVVVDLKENRYGKPLITEINLRHVAFTSTFANAGLNFCETQLLCLMNQKEKISIHGTKIFPKENAMFRDVDGLPVYIENFKMPKLGESFDVK